MNITMQELIPMLIEDGRYFVEGETEVPKFVQARTHKKWRINKKWKKRFGMKMTYERKMAKVADITLENVLEFCQEKGLPLPEEFLTMQNDCGSDE